MNPFDPRDPENLLAYMLFLGDDDNAHPQNGAAPRSNKGISCLTLAFGLFLIALAIAMLR